MLYSSPPLLLRAEVQNEASDLFLRGGCAALAMALGRKDDSSAKKIVSFSFWSSIGLGVIVGAVLLLFLDKMVALFGASKEA